jgi:hypothetical protein
MGLQTLTLTSTWLRINRETNPGMKRAVEARGPSFTFARSMASPDASPPPAQAAILLIYPLLKAIAWVTYSVVVVCLRLLGHSLFAVGRPLLALVNVVLAPIAFLLSPITFSARVLTDAFVLRPYSLASAIGEELYEVWVFVGVAIVIGIILGLVVRFVAQGAVRVILRLHPVGPRSHDGPASSAEAQPPPIEDTTTSTQLSNTPLGTRLGRVQKGRRQEWRRL